MLFHHPPDKTRDDEKIQDSPDEHVRRFTAATSA
jgi:hypothetical protein